MIPSNLAYDYVNNIPWDENPAFAFSHDAKYYIAAFEKVLDKTPDIESRISFEDNVWDFNPYFDGINNHNYRILFDGLPSPVLEYCKFYALYSIMGKRKISTASTRVCAFRGVYLDIIENTPHNTLSLITTEDIESTISRRNAGASATHNLYVAMHQVYSFLLGNYHLDLPVDLEGLHQKCVKYKQIDKQTSDKLPNIPEEYYNAIVQQAVVTMRDETEEYNVRCTACEIILVSQTGMRMGDLLAIRTTQLHSKRLAKTGVEVHYLHYKSRKPSKPHDPLLEFDIFANSLCVEAFETLRTLRERNPLAVGNDYLYVLEATMASKNVLPIPNYRFGSEFKRFLRNKLPELSHREWDGVPTVKLNLGAGKDPDFLAVPDSRQFRVHLCTSLYEHGIPLVYIQRYMGHLSEYMLGYYVRPKDTYQENVKYTEKIIKEIVQDDIMPLGGAFGPDIKRSIQDFVKANHFNVETDIEAIVASMGDRVIVRGKTGGVCIKTSLMPCAKDARSNEMFCAYNLCPNLFTFYYMADISYLDFQTLQQTISAMKSAGQTKAASKESNKLVSLCQQRLIPELDELDKEIDRKGIDSIRIKYPSLGDIIDRREDIRKEIAQWTKRS